jgi:hypothetical protein
VKPWPSKVVPIVAAVEQSAVIVIAAIGADGADPPPRSIEIAKRIAATQIATCVIVAGLEAAEHFPVGRLGLGEGGV